MVCPLLRLVAVGADWIVPPGTVAETVGVSVPDVKLEIVAAVLPIAVPVPFTDGLGMGYGWAVPIVPGPCVTPDATTVAVCVDVSPPIVVEPGSVGGAKPLLACVGPPLDCW